MRTVYWVYIAENRRGGMTIGFSVAMSRTLIEVSMREETITYLRPFSVPLDGLANKHLLEDLSKDTLRDPTAAFAIVGLPCPSLGRPFERYAKRPRKAQLEAFEVISVGQAAALSDFPEKQRKVIFARIKIIIDI